MNEENFVDLKLKPLSSHVKRPSPYSGKLNKKIQLKSFGKIFEWQRNNKMSVKTGQMFFQKNKTQVVIRLIE